MVIQVFVSSHLYYCNSVYGNSIHDRCHHLITVSPKLLTRALYCSQITPVLISSNCLPVKVRIQVKILLLISRLWIILLQSRSVIYLHRVPLLGPSGPLNTACCILIKSENTKGLCIRCPGSRLWDGLPLGISLSGLINLSRRPIFFWVLLYLSLVNHAALWHL